MRLPDRDALTAAEWHRSLVDPDLALDDPAYEYVCGCAARAEATEDGRRADAARLNREIDAILGRMGKVGQVPMIGGD